MKFRDQIRFAIESLMQNKLRSLLALAGVVLGSLLLFCSIASGLGILDAATRRMSAGDRLVQINVYSGFQQDPVTAESARAAGIDQDMPDEKRIRLAKAIGVGRAEPMPITVDALAEFQGMPHLDTIWADIQLQLTACVKSPGSANAGNDWARAFVQGLPPNGMDLSELIVAGRNVRGVDEAVVSELFLYQLGAYTDRDVRAFLGSEIQLSPVQRELEQYSAVARKLQRSPEAEIVFSDQQGKSPIQWGEVQRRLDKARAAVKVRSKPLRVVGVFKTPNDKQIQKDPTLVRAANRQLLISYDAAVDFVSAAGLNEKRFNAVAQVDSSEFTSSVETQIQAMGYRTRSFAQLAMQIRKSVLLITAIITTIATMALLISAFGIANTMIMNVMQRRGEIAIMKAVGARDTDIQRLFLLEGGLVGLTGGLIGIAAGLILGETCGQFIRSVLERQLEESFGGRIFLYPMWLVIGTPLLSGLVTTLATQLPARRAAAMDVVTTLRDL